MRTLTIALLLLATNALAPKDSRSEPSLRPTEPVTVESLAWLSGTWVGVQGKTEMEEVWMAPKGGATFFSSQTLAYLANDAAQVCPKQNRIAAQRLLRAPHSPIAQTEKCRYGLAGQ